MAIKSIGIIPDGTRRWAKREGVSLPIGYRHAFANLTEHIDALSQRGVKHIHIYMFSIYNLKRNPDEIIDCLDAECEFIARLIDCNRPIFVSGDVEAISLAHTGIGEVIKTIPSSSHTSVDKTAIYLYLGYSFIQHLETALKNERSISSVVEVLTKRSIDLVIRTGNAITLSDFLPIESRYAQIYFLPTLFNDFTLRDLMGICDQYDAAFHTLKHGE